jgi:hypothetical protein
MMSFPAFTWKQETLQDDLKQMADYAIAIADSSRKYYQNNSVFKRSWAKRLRMIAIFATAVSGVLPIVAQMTPEVDPAWATIAISFAITAIGVDRFFGFSSAWMRFVTTEIKLQGKIEQFRLQVENEKYSWNGNSPDFEKGRSLLNTTIAFLNEVSEIVKEETNTWMLEFQSALQKLNEDANVKEKTQAPGGIVIAIENGDKSVDGFSISLEGRPTVKATGSTYAFNNLYPKMYKLSVDGKIIEEKDNNKTEREVHAETVITVTPGTISNVSLVLK